LGNLQRVTLERDADFLGIHSIARDCDLPFGTFLAEITDRQGFGAISLTAKNIRIETIKKLDFLQVEFSFYRQKNLEFPTYFCYNERKDI
jgi:hypothetical protein